MPAILVYHTNMKADPVRHVRVKDEFDGLIEIKIWRLPKPTPDKPHGFKYSMVYIMDGRRVIGYDNAEGKGDHRHYMDKERPYEFAGIDKLIDDFRRDMERFKRGGK